MEKLTELIEKRDKLQRKISDIEYKNLIEVSLPKLKKAIGKCYKYNNSYGCGDNCRAWPLYIQIVSIDESNMQFKTIEFQYTTFGHVEVKTENKFNFNGKNYFNGKGYIEITNKEFNQAKKRFINTLTSLLK
jgi:hypothetical protein